LTSNDSKTLPKLFGARDMGDRNCSGIPQCIVACGVGVNLLVGTPLPASKDSRYILPT
jgi:hypothetical protein